MSPSDLTLVAILLALVYAAGAANARTPTKWRSLAGAVTLFAGLVLGVFLTVASLVVGG